MASKTTKVYPMVALLLVVVLGVAEGYTGINIPIEVFGTLGTVVGIGAVTKIVSEIKKTRSAFTPDQLKGFEALGKRLKDT